MNMAVPLSALVGLCQKSSISLLRVRRWSYSSATGTSHHVNVCRDPADYIDVPETAISQQIAIWLCSPGNGQPTKEHIAE